MATVGKPLPDGEAPLEEVDQLPTDRVGTRNKRRRIALRYGHTREEKARAFAARLAAALLAEVAPGDIPMLWETIEPQPEDWVALMELCGGLPDAAGMRSPKIREAQIIARALSSHTAQQAAFLLGVAIGQRLAPATDKAR